MKVLPGNGKESLQEANAANVGTKTEMSSLPDGFRLRQPEFDLVDETVRIGCEDWK